MTQQLQANNALGLNAVHIARLREVYMGYWAREVKVMQTYAAHVSHALAKLTPWQPLTPITTETGLARQAAAV